MPKRLDIETIKALRAAGSTVAEVAIAIGATRQGVYRVLEAEREREVARAVGSAAEKAAKTALRKLRKVAP